MARSKGKGVLLAAILSLLKRASRSVAIGAFQSAPMKWLLAPQQWLYLGQQRFHHESSMKTKEQSENLRAEEKSLIWETPNLSTAADGSTNKIVSAGVVKGVKGGGG